MSDYKLVPVEPTAGMMAAGGIEMGARDEDARTVWKAMIAAAPAVQGEPGVKWAPEEVANGNKGIRWVSDEGVHGRPTDHDCRVYLESNPNARGCHCPECTMLYAAPQPAAHQPYPEGIREGAPYDDPTFESLCREHEIWGTPAAAQCAVFWEGGKRAAEQQPAPDVAGLVEALVACGRASSAAEVGLIVDEALAPYRKGGEA